MNKVKSQQSAFRLFIVNEFPVDVDRLADQFEDARDNGGQRFIEGRHVLPHPHKQAQDARAHDLDLKKS